MTYRTRPDGSERPLYKLYDTALLELDGVVYAGGHPIPHAVVSLGEVRDGGMHLAYVTNNASRTPQAGAVHLTALGVPAAAGRWDPTAQRAWRAFGRLQPPGAA